MDNLEIMTLVIGISIFYVGLHYLDAKCNLRVVDWMNGTCDNPFTSASKTDSNATQLSNENALTVEELKARIVTLEKIVTEPAYELNQKINQL